MYGIMELMERSRVNDQSPDGSISGYVLLLTYRLLRRLFGQSRFFGRPVCGTLCFFVLYNGSTVSVLVVWQA